MPSASIMARLADRSIWYSGSARVRAGATTMESPVWMPTGSTFSMEQTAITLPMPSRMVSNSISFQPAMLRSTRIWEMGERSSPVRAMEASVSRSGAMPPPLPPSVKAGRTITG